jgi:hypothetical protein
MSFQSSIGKDMGYLDTLLIERRSHQQSAVALQGLSLGAHKCDPMIFCPAHHSRDTVPE